MSNFLVQFIDIKICSWIREIFHPIKTLVVMISRVVGKPQPFQRIAVNGSRNNFSIFFRAVLWRILLRDGLCCWYLLNALRRRLMDFLLSDQLQLFAWVFAIIIGFLIDINVIRNLQKVPSRIWNFSFFVHLLFRKQS